MNQRNSGASRAGLAVLAVSFLVATGCGSYLSEEALLTANNAQFSGQPGAAGAGGSGAASPSAGEAGAASTASGAAGPDAATTDPAAAGQAPAGQAAAGTSAGGASGAGRSNSSTAGPGAASSARATAAAGTPTAAGARPGSTGGATGSGAATPSAGASDGSAGGTPAPTAPTRSDGSVLKLGSIGVRSGPLGAAMQPGHDAARAWVNDANSRGGLNGHPVELIQVDDRGDPNQAVALARRLVEQDGVIAFFAANMPTTAQAIAPYAEQKQIPIVGSCICNTDIDASPMFFEAGTGSSDGLAWEHIGGLIETTDIREVAVFYCREAATCSNLLAGVKKFAPQVGLKIVYEAQMSIAQPDYTAEVIQARNAGAKGIITLSDNATTIRIARSAHRQNYDPVILTQHSGSDERFIRDGGADVEGAFVAGSTALWSTSPAMADYRAAMDRWTPGAPKGAMGANIWASGKMLEKISAGFPAKPGPADILTGLYSLRGETLGGRIPPTAFIPGQSHRNTNPCHVPTVIKGGKFAPIRSHDTFSCPPGWKPVQP
jgi:branched-chain amino acid transport system substrate-binding protein